MLINFYSLHYDKVFWGDPENFRPERHLNSEGNIIKTDHYFPFGGGMNHTTLFIFLFIKKKN